jgi:hypothetical protein
MNAMNPSFWVIHCWDSFSTHPSLRGAQTVAAPPGVHTLSWQPFNAIVQSWTAIPPPPRPSPFVKGREPTSPPGER